MQNIIPSIWPVTAHTDHIGPGSTYVVIKGQKFDGIEFISLALERGATTIVIEESISLDFDLCSMIELHGARLIRVTNSRKALAELSAAAWGYPAKQLKFLGVTGTKGKTTTTYLLMHILKTAGYKTAMLTGVKNYINDQELPSALTTPQPDYLHTFLTSCIQQNVEYVVMEVSAQALSLHRIDNLLFDGIVFTNLSQEHAEFYVSIDDYFAAKCKFFGYCKSDTPAIINIDDQWGKEAANRYTNSFTVSMRDEIADYYIKSNQFGLMGLSITIQGKQEDYSFNSKKLVGQFNAYNAADAALLALKLGIKQSCIAQAFNSFVGVPGRMEGYVLPNGSYAIIDYAHTPSSFSYVIPMLKQLTKQLIVVFGAGGERDHTKRPIMGNIAATYADIVIITADNPRSEDADDIAQQIIAGISKTDAAKVICELDRKNAIEKAYELAKPGSIVLLLGKGPDEYQIIGKEKFYFSDAKTILAYSKQL